MLEVESPDSEAGAFRDDLSDEEKRSLLQCFLDAVSADSIVYRDKTNSVLVLWSSRLIHSSGNRETHQSSSTRKREWAE